MRVKSGGDLDASQSPGLDDWVHGVATTGSRRYRMKSRLGNMDELFRKAELKVVSRHLDI